MRHHHLHHYHSSLHSYRHHPAIFSLSSSIVCFVFSSSLNMCLFSILISTFQSLPYHCHRTIFSLFLDCIQSFYVFCYVFHKLKLLFADCDLCICVTFVLDNLFLF
uniref:(northern house mosquito) hypothetical protein n=1 Tax=Culex pipiens TaxID=7175 RepID=A0A8D8AHJ9_CULPI